MKKVLMCLSSFSRGNGVAKFVMNYYQSLIDNGYEVHFLLVNKGISDEKYLNIIKDNNGKIFYVPHNNILNRIPKTRRIVKEILNKYKYEIVHVNLVDLYAYACIKEAKNHNVNKIIYHIHNPKSIGKLLFFRDILNYMCIKSSTNLVACTEYAGKSIFRNKKFNIIRNAINFNDYKYDENAREKYLEEFDIKDKFVIGTVGRLCDQKNPIFTLKIIRELRKIKSNIFFIWVGIGPLKEKMEKYIKENDLSKHVLILNNREDVNKIYSCFDIFLLPSKYEGLGIVFLEAQCSGLKVYTSNKVPKEIKQSDLVDFIALNKDERFWANEIIKDQTDYIKRHDYMDILKKGNYDINKNYNSLIKIYEE